MAHPSERELKKNLDDLRDDDGDGAIEFDICLSWRGDCDHDDHDTIVSFSDT